MQRKAQYHQAFCLAASSEVDSEEDYRPIYVHAKVSIIDDFWSTVRSANLNNRGMRDDTEMNVATLDAKRASKRTRIETLPKLTEAVHGQYRIKDDPPLISHLDPLEPGRDNLDIEAWKAFVLEYLASLPEERRVIIFAEPIQIKI